MKKYLLILAILTFTITIFATNLQDVYHRNYGLIDRVVLVFDSKPKHKIIAEDHNLTVTLLNCQKNSSVQNKIIENNQILTSFRYGFYENNISFKIGINTLIQENNNYNFSFDSFGFYEDNHYKLVFDLFATNSPKTPDEFQSFIDFHQQLENINLVEKYKNLQKEAKIDSIKNEVQEKIVPKNVDEIPANIKQSKKNIFKHFNKKQLFIFGLSIVFLILLLILIIILNRRKQLKKMNSELVSFRSTNGFGDEKFQKEIIQKLVKSGWNNDEIAKEMNLNTEKIEALKLEK